MAIEKLDAEMIEKLEMAAAKMEAMSVFALEVKSFMEDLLKQEGIVDGKIAHEPKEEKAQPKKVEKAEKVVEVEKPEVKVETEKASVSAEEVDSIIEEYGLLEMSVDELKEELTANGIKVPAKPTVEALAKLVAESILSGAISVEDGEEEPVEEVVEPEKVEVQTAEEVAEEEEGYTEEEINEMSLEDLTELCKENDIKIPVAAKKNVNKLRAHVISFICDTEEEEQAEEAPVVEEKVEEVAEEKESFPASAERLAKEEEVATEVREKIAGKKLTIAAMKKELKKYYEGDADCKDCKGCTEEEVIECYTLLKQSFVDDEGDLHKAKDPYYRNDEVFCCGAMTQDHPDTADVKVCTICGEEIDLSE